MAERDRILSTLSPSELALLVRQYSDAGEDIPRWIIRKHGDILKTHENAAEAVRAGIARDRWQNRRASMEKQKEDTRFFAEMWARNGREYRKKWMAKQSYTPIAAKKR